MLPPLTRALTHHLLPGTLPGAYSALGILFRTSPGGPALALLALSPGTPRSGAAWPGEHPSDSASSVRAIKLTE